MADISQITLPNGDVVTIKDSAGREAATTGLAGKVSIAQGVQNQGKILQVSSGGVLELVDPGTGSGDVTGPASSVNNQVAVFDGTTGKVIKDSGFTIGKSVPSDAVFTDTTYESKTAASGGTDVSLVTTGEKYTWNSKPNSSDIPTKVSDLQNDSGFTDNEGTVTGIKMNNGTAIEPDADGVVDLGTVITSHQDISGKADLVDGKVPSTQLPSYVDDVLEYASQASFPLTGETGKIYIAIDTNKTYRWGGSAYVEISESLALGTTSSTAYRGDYGDTAYTHATDSSRLTTAQTSGLYKIATTAEGHVASVTSVQKSDITALGIPESDTTYSAATQSANGLMSSIDKTKLDGVATGATANVGTVTGVKMNSGSAINPDGNGVVDLGTVITSHQTLPDGTTSEKGMVQLEDSTSSTSTTKAATPNSVKAAYDLAATKSTLPNVTSSDNGKVLTVSSGAWSAQDPQGGAPTTLSLTAAAGSWSSATPPTQTITATGVTSSNTIIVGLASDATDAQIEAARNACIRCTAQGTNSITLTAYGTEPEVNIPVSVVILG